MDSATIFTILGTVAALVFGAFGMWTWFRARSKELRKETRHYFVFGATLAKVGYHTALKTEEKDVVETLTLALTESARKLDLSPELSKEVDGFLHSPGLTTDRLPDLRNKITRSINVSISASAATAFYLGFNVINLLMLAQLGTVTPSLASQASAIAPFKAVLGEVIRDSERLGISVRRLRALKGLSTQQPADYFALASASISDFLDHCEKVMGRTA